MVRSMVRLKNIEIEKTIAKADFSPESTGLWGHIEVDLSTQEIVSVKHVPGYGISYSGHAKYKLVEMAETGDVRTECLVMWY